VPLADADLTRTDWKYGEDRRVDREEKPRCASAKELAIPPPHCSAAVLFMPARLMGRGVGRSATRPTRTFSHFHERHKYSLYGNSSLFSYTHPRKREICPSIDEISTTSEYRILEIPEKEDGRDGRGEVMAWAVLVLHPWRRHLDSSLHNTSPYTEGHLTFPGRKRLYKYGRGSQVTQHSRLPRTKPSPHPPSHHFFHPASKRQDRVGEF